MIHRLSGLLLFVLIAGAAFAQFSADKELIIGRHMAAEINSEQERITDAEVTALVDRVLKTLSRTEAELAGLLSHAMGHVQVGQFSRPATSTGTGLPWIFISLRWDRAFDRRMVPISWCPPRSLLNQTFSSPKPICSGWDT